MKSQKEESRVPTDLEVVDEVGLLEALVEDGREEDEDEHAAETDSLHANATVELVVDKEGRKVVWRKGGERQGAGEGRMEGKCRCYRQNYPST